MCGKHSGGKRKADPVLMTTVTGEETDDGLALHPMDHVGIDTCSARSVSSEIADFLYLDTSVRAINSVELNGVGNGGPTVLGRGPMVVLTVDREGVQTFMVDPAGVLIASTGGQARLRIFGQQRMNTFGYCVVQDYSSRDNTLIYKDLVRIPLATKRGILMVKTSPWNLNQHQMDKLRAIVDGVVAKRIDHFCFQIECQEAKETLPLLVLNEAKLSREKLNRIDHWRHGHRSSSGERYMEKCHTCEASKHKATYKRNKVFNGTSVSTNLPYWRLYSDAYGGQRSMGVESYEGGIGGFVFACPVSGTIKTKIYSTL